MIRKFTPVRQPGLIIFTLSTAVFVEILILGLVGLFHWLMAVQYLMGVWYVAHTTLNLIRMHRLEEQIRQSEAEIARLEAELDRDDPTGSWRRLAAPLLAARAARAPRPQRPDQPDDQIME